MHTSEGPALFSAMSLHADQPSGPLAGITVRSARAQAFVRELGRPDVDMTAVRALCFLGCPDEAPAVRLVAWELLLGVLGTQPALWRVSRVLLAPVLLTREVQATKAANRETYRGYVQGWALTRGRGSMQLTCWMQSSTARLSRPMRPSPWASPIIR